MPSRRVTVTIEDGLHARPVAELVKLAARHPSGATLSAGGTTADLSSVLAVMNLALRRGDEVTVTVPESSGADRLLDALTLIMSPGSANP